MFGKADEFFELFLGERADVASTGILVLYGIKEDGIMFWGVDSIRRNESSGYGGNAGVKTVDEVIWNGRVFVDEAGGEQERAPAFRFVGRVSFESSLREGSAGLHGSWTRILSTRDWSRDPFGCIPRLVASLSTGCGSWG